MGLSDELIGNSPNNGLAATLREGVRSLSRDQFIVFNRYVRVVLPLDGFVFWVKGDILSSSALANAAALNTAMPGQEPTIATPALTLKVEGSFHKATAVEQNEDETFGRQRVIFTALAEVNDLIAVGPNEIWITEYEGARFAFSARGSFYRQADLFHYTGDALYPDMESQVIDSPLGFDSSSLVISNSLPVWLSLSNPPAKPWQAPRQVFPVYPSFAVPANISPPWATIHIGPEDTESLASAPFIDSKSGHAQLSKDTVRITLWGLRNNAALDFVDAVVSLINTSHPPLIGLMGMVPAIKDEKRTQRELNVLAMKKTVTFEVSYNQSRINDFARQLILEAVPNVVFGKL